jgi:hypothetical protein
LVLWRDTVHVTDARDFRASLFDTLGVHLLSYRSLLPNGSRLRMLAGGPIGWFVADDSLFSSRTREAVGEAAQSAISIKRVDPAAIERAANSRAAADSILTAVVTYLGMRTFGMLGSEGGNQRGVLGNPPFFEPYPSHAIDGLGNVYVASGWPYVVDMFDANGVLRRRISRSHDSIAVDDRLVDEVLRRAKAHYDTTRGTDGATYRTYSERAKMPVVGYVPVTRTLRVSPDGWLWVRRIDIEPDPVVIEWSVGVGRRATYWDVFNPAGLFQMTVRLPSGFSPHQVAHDAVTGVLLDDFDVQHVVTYNLIRPRGNRNR